MEKSLPRGASEATHSSDSEPRRKLYGDGRRAHRRRVDSPKTRTTHDATRYIETEFGILTYQELAPLLAERVSFTELDIARRKFAALPVEQLLLELHQRICENLVPDIAGRWRVKEVQVGLHIPPPHWRVPVLMREFAADLETRLASSGVEQFDQTTIDLAFAEGRFLYIHPFEDFNGRITRLFLFELLHRLDLPIMDTATRTRDEKDHYLEALGAYDRNDPRPLVAVWKRRIAMAA